MQTSHLGKTDAESHYRHNTDNDSSRQFLNNACRCNAFEGKNPVCDTNGNFHTGRNNGNKAGFIMTNAFTTLETLVTVSLSLLVFSSFLTFAVVLLKRTGEENLSLAERVQILQTEAALKNYVESIDTSYMYNNLPVLQVACEKISSGEIFKNHVFRSSDLKIDDVRIIYDKKAYRRGIQATYSIHGNTRTTKAIVSETEVLNSNGEFSR